MSQTLWKGGFEEVTAAVKMLCQSVGLVRALFQTADLRSQLLEPSLGEAKMNQTLTQAWMSDVTEQVIEALQMAPVARQK